MGNRTTSLTATNKVATVNPTTARTEPPRAATEDRMTPTVATNRAAMAEPINRTEIPKAGTDNQTTPMGVTEVVTVNPTTNRTGTPRAAMDDRMTRTATKKVATVNPTTARTEPPRAATVDRTTTDRKLPTEAAPLVAADRTTTLTGATREAMTNLTMPITLVPMGSRKYAAAVRDYVLVVRNTC